MGLFSSFELTDHPLEFGYCRLGAGFGCCDSYLIWVQLKSEDLAEKQHPTSADQPTSRGGIHVGLLPVVPRESTWLPPMARGRKNGLCIDSKRCNYLLVNLLFYLCNGYLNFLMNKPLTVCILGFAAINRFLQHGCIVHQTSFIHSLFLFHSSRVELEGSLPLQSARIPLER